jgi:Flp pilus assembly protein TadD
VATPFQAGYWKSSETLFRHAIETTENNGVMETSLGKVLLDQGRVKEASDYLQQAVIVNPGLPKAHYNFGRALLAQGQLADALAQFEIQVNLEPDDPIAQFTLGSTLSEHGRAGEGLPHLRKAAELTPRIAEAHYQLGNALLQLGRIGEAVTEYEEALQIVPGYFQCLANLAWVLAAAPDASLRNGARAVELASRANELSGGQNPKVLGMLAAAYAEAGKFAEAIATVQKALQFAGGPGNAAVGNLLRSQLALYQAGAPVRDATLAAPASPPRSP